MVSAQRRAFREVFVAGAGLGLMLANFPSGVGADLVTDGTFDNPAAWTQAAPATLLVTGGEGRVSARGTRDSGIRQGLLTPLLAAGSGIPWTTTCRIKTNAPTAARLVLRITEGGVIRDETLAEGVLDTAGVWTDLKGTWQIDWEVAPTQADLRLFLGHQTRDVLALPGGGLFPDFSIDDIRIEADMDADGIPSVEEAMFGTTDDNPDFDDDGMPDGWEVTYGTNPLVDDADSQGDSDGYTNLQEYGAATDPFDGASFPGLPANPRLSARAQDILDYLALRPSAGAVGRALVGQHITTPSTEFIPQVVDLAALPDSRWVSVVEFQYDDVANPPTTALTNGYAIQWWNDGGIVAIKWLIRHPWRTSNPHPGYCPTSASPCPVPDTVDIQALLNPVTPTDQAAHDFFMGELDAVAAGLQELRDQDIPVLWRFCAEMNGGHFWWGQRARQDYIDLWRFIFHYFTDPAGWDLTNLIWVYESDLGPHSKLPVDYYYPGNDVVDVAGHNFYHGTFNADYDLDAIFRRYPKVYACPQTGPDHAHRDGTFDNMTYLTGEDGESGFIHRHPRLSWFNVWNSFLTDNLAIVDNLNPELFLRQDWLVTRDELPVGLAGPTSSSVDNWTIFE